MPKVFLSPSNQFDNLYAWGNTNEGKQMGIIAQLEKKALERCGFEVMLMHKEDMPTKVEAANKWGADLYIPNHSNACNGKAAGTRLFCWSIPGAGYDACLCVNRYLGPLSPGETDKITTYPSLYEVRNPYAPVVYIEIDFHDVPEVAKWIVEHSADIAEAITRGVCDYFGMQYKAPEDGSCSVKLPVLQNGDSSGYVKSIQAILNAKNRAGLVEDGVFGPATEKAVKAYQKAKKLTVDGIVGEKTWAQLLK